MTSWPPNAYWEPRTRDPTLRICYLGCLKGPLNADIYIYIDIDVDVEVDVDTDRRLGCGKGGFKVGSGTVEWYRTRYSTDFHNPEIATPVDPKLQRGSPAKPFTSSARAKRLGKQGRKTLPCN